MKTFAHKGFKIAMQKKVCFLANFAVVAVFFVIGATICIGQEMLSLPDGGFFFTEYSIICQQYSITQS